MVAQVFCTSLWHPVNRDQLSNDQNRKYYIKKIYIYRKNTASIFLINGDSENTICLEEPKDPQAAFAILVVGMLFRAAAQTITN